MKGRRVKFVWGASQVIRGRWHLGLFGFYERQHGRPDSGLAISVRGLLVGGAALALAGYLAAAAALFWIWQRNGFSELRFADALFYPMRRSEVSAAKGRAFLARGKALFDAGKYVDAANLLRYGLARHPRDFVARRQLAQFYLMANRRPAALTLLAEGLGPAYPGRPYLELYFEIAAQGEDYARVAAVCTRYAGMAPSETERRWLADRHFTALLDGGQPAAALTFAVSEGETARARHHRAQALLALQRIPEALEILDAWEEQAGPERAALLRLRVRALGQAGRIEEMSEAITELHRLAPAEPDALAYGVAQLAEAQRDDLALRALDDYLFRFGGSPANIFLVAELLAGVGHEALLQRCVTAAMDRGYPISRFQLQLAQFHLQQGEWGAAATLLEQIVLPPDRNAAAAQAWRGWAQRLIAAATTQGDAAQLPLVELLRARPWPLRIIRQSLEAMMREERLDTAREIAAVGRRAYPDNAWLQAKEVELAELIAARPADPPTAHTAAAVPGEMAFFSELEQAIDANHWDDVERAIRNVRAHRPPPEWLGRRDADLWFVLMRSSQARGDRVALMAAARMNLLGGPNRAGGLLELSRNFDAAGDRDSGLLLVNAILQRFPDYAPAKRQLAQWTPIAAEAPAPAP